MWSSTGEVFSVFKTFNCCIFGNSKVFSSYWEVLLLKKDNIKSETKRYYPLSKHLLKVRNTCTATSMVVILVSLSLTLKRYLLIGWSPYFKSISANHRTSISKIILKKAVLMKFREVSGEHA